MTHYCETDKGRPKVVISVSAENKSHTGRSLNYTESYPMSAKNQNWKCMRLRSEDYEMKRQPLLVAGLVCNLILTTVWKDKRSVGRHDEREDNYGRRAVKRKFHGSSFLVPNVTTILLTCHITRKLGVSNVSDEDASNISSWCSGVSLTCPQQVVRVMVVEFEEQHDKRVALPNTCNILVTSYRDVGHVYDYEDVMRMLRGNCSHGI